MKKFLKLNIDDIPFEAIHDVPNSRKTLVYPHHLTTENLEAITKGFLKPGQVWDWHKHENMDEVCIVIKGTGNYFCEEEQIEYKKDDVIIVHANSMHKIEANGNEASEFYFIRVKV